MGSRNVCAACIVAFTAACGGPQGSEQQQSAVISDSAHEGRVGFYFLPPLVSQPHAAGTFDPSFAPRVEIRDLTLGTVVVTFEPAEIEVDQATEQYSVNWDTKSTELDAAHTYRITVMLYEVVIGFADVDVVASGRELKNVVSDEYIALLDGRTLPIKFRLERGVVDDLVPRVTISLHPLWNGLTAGSGGAWFSAYSGTPSALSFECTVNGAGVPCQEGTPLVWSQLPDGSAVDVRITATAIDTGITGPTAIATATVDAVAPVNTDLSVMQIPSDGIPVLQVSFQSTDSVADGTVFRCALDGMPFDCSPGTNTVTGDYLIDGPHTVTIDAVDLGGQGNHSIPISAAADIDLTAPVFPELGYVSPDSSVCPASTPATQVRFVAIDASNPVTYGCDLLFPDGHIQSYVPCDGIAATNGIFTWNDLPNGSYALVVSAYDAYGNRGISRPILFSVDHLPPTVEVNIVDPPVILVTLTEQGPPQPHLPMTIVDCEILLVDGNIIDCTCDPMVTNDTSTCTYSGLSDTSRISQVRITAQDSCGSG